MINEQDKFYGTAIAIFVGILFILAVEAPRGFAFMPSIFGLALMAIHKVKYGDYPKLEVKPFIFISVILLLASASILWTDGFYESARSIQNLWIVLPTLSIFIGVISSVPSGSARRAMELAPVGFAIAAVLLMVEMVSNGAVQKLFVAGELPSYQFNSPCVALVLLVFAGIPKPKGILCTIGIVALGIAVSATESQSAQLAFIAGAFIFVIFRFLPANFWPWVWRGFGVSLVAITIAWPFVASVAYKTLADDLQENSIIAKAAPGHRMQIWDAVSRYALKKPVFGRGIDATRAAGQLDTDHRFAKDGATIHPHNTSLQIWVEFGAFGVAIFSIGILVLSEMAARVSLKYPDIQPMRLAAVCAACVPLLFAYGVWQNWWLGVIFTSLALLSLARNSRQ